MDAQHRRRTVVVGVDGSEHALRAVRWGAAEALRRRVPLRLVNAFTWKPDHALGQPGLGQRREILLGRARGDLAAAAGVAEQEAAGVEVEQQLIVGYPIAVLSEESRRAQVLVVGDRGLSRIEGVLAGSVAIALAAHADCPVVVVRGTERDASSATELPVVVGVDGSSTSEAAVAFAVEAAVARGVPLVAVHTWSDLGIDPTLGPMLNWDALVDEERELLAERLAGWTEKHPDLRVERLVTCDRPARTLLEQAAGAQLVVVGSRGHGGLAGLVLGSVSNSLVHRAACPVAVVRPDPEEHQ